MCDIDSAALEDNDMTSNANKLIWPFVIHRIGERGVAVKKKSFMCYLSVSSQSDKKNEDSWMADN